MLDRLLKYKESSQKSDKKALSEDNNQNCTTFNNINDDQNATNIDVNVNSDTNGHSCHLSVLSKEEFIKIGSYLSSNSRLHLSMTNRLFHKQVQ